MTTEKNNRSYNRLLTDLQSGQPMRIGKAVEELREEGDPSYLPVLIGILQTSGDEEIQKQIKRLLGELKNEEAVPLLIDAIRNRTYTGLHQALISACWENGLDYSGYLSLFVDLVIERDFLVAFEAHTVITSMTAQVSPAIIAQELDKIRAARSLAEPDKSNLLQDLLEFLPGLEAGINERMEY